MMDGQLGSPSSLTKMMQRCNKLTKNTWKSKRLSTDMEILLTFSKYHYCLYAEKNGRPYAIIPSEKLMNIHDVRLAKFKYQSGTVK